MRTHAEGRLSISTLASHRTERGSRDLPRHSEAPFDACGRIYVSAHAESSRRSIAKASCFCGPPDSLAPMGKTDNWSQSALEAATTARDTWIRVQANMSVGAYEISKTRAEIPDPDWPEKSFCDLIRLAFGEYFIKDLGPPRPTSAPRRGVNGLDHFRQVWFVGLRVLATTRGAPQASVPGLHANSRSGCPASLLRRRPWDMTRSCG